MKGAEDRLVVAGIGDLHVREGDGPALRDLFAEISGQADVLALCGDLTDLGTPRQAEVLAEQLVSCTIPVVGVLGNHDLECGREDEVIRILASAGLRFLETEVHEVGGVAFAGVKGFLGGFGRYRLGSFGEAGIKRVVEEAANEAARLESALRRLDARRIVVVLHYAPVADTVAGEPKEIFPFLGSSHLAETIDRYGVSAVLHGHAHHGTYAGRTPKGIPVYNCASAVRKESGRPYALIEV